MADFEELNDGWSRWKVLRKRGILRFRKIHKKISVVVTFIIKFINESISFDILLGKHLR